MVQDVTMSLKKLRQFGFAHRDVTLENILLYNSRFKLCDFGFATGIWRDGLYKQCGKYRYLAPEIIDTNLQIHRGRLYDISKADVFSIGVSFFTSLIGVYPQLDFSTSPFAIEIYLCCRKSRNTPLLTFRHLFQHQ